MKSLVPPHNLEAEQSVLGGLMYDSESWDSVADVVKDEDFYKPAHQKIYSVIYDLHKRHLPVDLLTVTSALRDKGELDAIGGPAYIAEMVEQTASTVNIKTYAEIVSEKALIRRLIGVSNRISERAFASDYEDIGRFLDQVEGEIFNVAEQRKITGLTAVSDIVRVSLETIEELYEKKGSVTGTASGFTDLDKLTAGFQPRELIIVAARPSMGKTAFSLNLALHAAIREKKKVAYFSVEMGKEQLMTRLLAQEAKINLSDIRTGRIADAAWGQLINAASVLSECSLFIDDTSGISPFEIRAKARRLQAMHGLDMIFVDYLQLMKLNQKTDSREREVAEISRMLKEIAKELRVPVIALAQLNRGVEGRGDRRPMLSDLRESGSIEQDADLIMMLYRDEYYDKEKSESKGVAEVHVNKHRNGPTGIVKLAWLGKYGLFANLAPNDLGPAPEPDKHGEGPAGGPTRLPNFAPRSP